MWREEELPEEWKKRVVVPIVKKETGGKGEGLQRGNNNADTV